MYNYRNISFLQLNTIRRVPITIKVIIVSSNKEAIVIRQCATLKGMMMLTAADGY